ncbi:uncharacterized protein [Palaemon carinicauda]|uniref:uncharacterized protein isoform X1 n=1 Tax=Palaemon carinicauda TaxID=392227 RepID=UPI0035B659A6
MKFSTAIFQRTLILATLLAAFASTIPPGPKVDQCVEITERLQTKLKTQDPYTYPNDYFTFTGEDTSLIFNFINKTDKGFSKVICEFFSIKTAQMTLRAPNLESSAVHAQVYGTLHGRTVLITSPFSLQTGNQRFDLRFHYDSYSQDPFSLCITDGSLQITTDFESMEVNLPSSQEVTQELSDHPNKLKEALNIYLLRSAIGFSTTLNEALCSSHLPPVGSAKDDTA